MENSEINTGNPESKSITGKQKEWREKGLARRKAVGLVAASVGEQLKNVSYLPAQVVGTGLEVVGTGLYLSGEMPRLQRRVKTMRRRSVGRYQ